MCDHNVQHHEKSVASSLYEAGGAMLQNFDPIKQIGQHVCGVHFYAHDGSRSVQSHHFCSHISEDMHQCVIYDSPNKDAKLIGVEYIITKRLFDTLPDDEKRLWHSHHYEVTSGSLFMPFLSAVPQAVGDRVEHQEMTHLVNTYGKTWHLWQVDRGDQLPIGPAQLMMSYTEELPIPQQMVKKIEREFGIDVEKKVEHRKDIKYDAPDPNANSWLSGKSFQAELKQVDFNRSRS